MPDVCFLCQILFDARKSKEIQTMADKPKTIVDARQDEKGNISAVKLQGNQTFTPLETAIRMAEQGKIDAVVVTPKDAKQHLRTRPDNKTKNNLDELAKD